MDQAELQRRPIGELAGYWLAVTCCRGRGLTLYPLRLLARQQSADSRLGVLLPRFRCQACRQRPQKFELCQTPYHDDASRTMAARQMHGWRIELLPSAGR